MAIILPTAPSWRLNGWPMLRSGCPQVVSAVVNRAIMQREAENQVSQLTEDDQDSGDGSGVAMVMVKWSMNPSALKSHFSPSRNH